MVSRHTDRHRSTEHPEGGHAPMNTPPIVSPEEWKAARQKLLVEEKEMTRGGDALAAKRRRMPWMVVEKDYRFEGPTARRACRTCSRSATAHCVPGLLRARSHHLPDVRRRVPERACVGCSFGADQVAHPAHLNERNTTLVFVSRAPQAEIQGLKGRMGWNSPLVHAHRRLRCGLRRRRVARDQRLHP